MQSRRPKTSSVMLSALTTHKGIKSKLWLQKKIAADNHVSEHKILDIDLTQIGGSALTDSSIDVPDYPTQGIPTTYVPARNTIFLSFALAYAETLSASDIFIGVNAVDYSGYPDCRPEYIKAFQNLAKLATRASVEEENIVIHTPLINMSKAEIIKKALELDAKLESTISCYQPDDSGRACGVCDSCQLRRNGFKNAGIEDPTQYVSR